MARPVSYLVFARYPEPGRVKTRLAAVVGAEAACALYRAMLADILHRVLQRGHHTTVCITPPDRTEEFRALLAAEGLLHPLLSLVPQRGATLGDRMYTAFADARAAGHLPAIMIGTDSPTLPTGVFEQAEHLLGSGAAAVLGPSEDGGFYLIGLADVREEFFFGGDYSNSTVYARTCDALARWYALPPALPVWYDIDDAEGLERLRAEPLPTLRAVAPRTAARLHTPTAEAEQIR